MVILFSRTPQVGPHPNGMRVSPAVLLTAGCRRVSPSAEAKEPRLEILFRAADQEVLLFRGELYITPRSKTSSGCRSLPKNHGIMAVLEHPFLSVSKATVSFL